MMIDVGVDTEDSSAVAISSAAMSKLKNIDIKEILKRTSKGSVKKIMQFYAYLIPKLFPTEDSNTYFISRDHLSEEEYFEKQQWQKFNRQPWELVEQIWKETSANRILVIHQKDESTISSTLFDWPILQHANGYILVCLLKVEELYYSIFFV
ncbi:Peroxisomal sarcosine oxidase [Armadillidium vulgare]|nr:Peroxisomal sarcosine oxidase [Armadillidium vulgare]